jgi:signal peptidase I
VTPPGQTSDDAAEPTAEAKPRKNLPWWQETILLLVLALVLAILIKTFFVQAFYIPSPSMEPQFVENDRILVQKVSYWGGGTPQRGDIVVFEDPGDWLPSSEEETSRNPVTRLVERIGLYPAGGHVVKRVIGVAGDRVVCCDDRGRVTVNGRALDEKGYLPRGTAPSTTRFDVRVPQGRLWVMGDNRGDSADSRAHMGGPGGGFVPVDDVVGRVFALVWPWGRAQLIHRPDTFAAVPDAP